MRFDTHITSSVAFVQEKYKSFSGQNCAKGCFVFELNRVICGL